MSTQFTDKRRDESAEMNDKDSQKSPEFELNQAFLRLAQGMHQNGRISDETMQEYRNIASSVR